MKNLSLRKVTIANLPKGVKQFLVKINRGDSYWWFVLRPDYENNYFLDSDDYVVSQGIVEIYPLPDDSL